MLKYCQGDTMIKNICVHTTDCTNPYINLATEKILLDSVKDDEMILYLWQNQNTVVIGRNQNPWAECNCTLMDAENVRLARRLSGGGAVFHDLGNLNFTFISTQENYSLENNLQIIKIACSMAGINAEVSGRNDILAEGKKFSGNAFYNSKGKSYHHGTILINADKEKLNRYLTPSKAKLEAKGVKSVKSRVINLTELNPDLTIKTMIKNLSEAFESVYPDAVKKEASVNTVEINMLAKIFESREHLYGTQPPFTFSCDGRFDWGGIEIKLYVEKGIIKTAKVYTDSMDWELAPITENILTDCIFDRDKIIEAIKKLLPQKISEDVVKIIKENI